MIDKEFDMKKIVNMGSLDFSKPETQKELLNIIETLARMVISLKQENQDLKDEINRLVIDGSETLIKFLGGKRKVEQINRANLNFWSFIECSL